MSRKPIRPRTVRVRRDPVTGELETTVLDSVQRAYERVHAAIDREMLQLDAPARERLAARVVDLAEGMRPHTERAAE
jgi:hypothetical protein